MSKKSKTILGWFLLILVLSIVFAYLNNSQISKDKLITLAIEDCVKNSPFNPSWQQKLAKTTILPDYNKIADFCQCSIGQVLASIPENELQNIHQLNSEEMLERFGGKDMIEQRDAACFDKIIYTTDK